MGFNNNPSDFGFSEDNLDFQGIAIHSSLSKSDADDCAVMHASQNKLTGNKILNKSIKPPPPPPPPPGMIPGQRDHKLPPESPCSDNNLSSTVVQDSGFNFTLYPGHNPSLSLSRLLPILANVPCAVTLLDLDTGPIFQNGLSCRFVII